MTKTLRRYILSIVVAITITVLMLSTTIQPAKAWTQEYNDFNPFTIPPSGNPVCGQSQYSPCISWPRTSSGLSITVYAWIEPTVYSNYDFRPAINAAITNFNNAPTNNPFYAQCYYSGCGSVAYDTALLNFCTYGEATFQVGSSFWSSSQGQWDAYLTSGTVRFTSYSNTTWNTTDTFYCNGSNNTMQADAIAVAGHETGHTQGLGHTAYAGALMSEPVNGNTPSETLQPNDTEGLQHIYG
jgi:hypothetical protein